MLSRSVNFLDITRFSLPSLLSTRRFAPEASAVLAKVPSMFNVWFSCLAMVSPLLPANFIPSSMVATWISSMTIRVMPSTPSTPGTPSMTPMVPDAPVGPVRPIVPLAPLRAIPDSPSAPFTPIKPSTPSSPSWPGPPTLSSSSNATIRLLPTLVTLIFLLSPLIVTTSSGLTLLFTPSPESVRTNHPLLAVSLTSFNWSRFTASVPAIPFPRLVILLVG